MLRRIPRPLGVLLLVAALLSVAWTFTTAPLQGPDEPAHHNYTQYLAETGSKPSVSEGLHPDSTQTGTALAYFNLAQLTGDVAARPAWSEAEEQRFEAILEQFGEKAEEDGSGPNPLAKNPPLYYAYEAVPYAVGSAGSYWERLVLMRLASGLLFLLTVVFTWLTAAELFARTWPRIVATGCVALLPQLTFLSGTVNADNLLVTVWTAFAFAALRLVRRGPTLRRTLAVCGIAVLSMLTHGRGLAILFPLAVAVAIAFLHFRPGLRRSVAWLLAGAGLLVLGFVAYRAFLAPAGGAYGGEVNTGAGLSVRQLAGWTWQFYFPRVSFMEPRSGPSYGYREVLIESFFGRFGALEISYGERIYDLIQAVVAVGLAGLVAAVAGRWQAVRGRWPQVAVLASMTVAMFGLLHVASYRALRTGPDPLITGRYFLPLVVVFGCTVAFVLSSARPRAGAVLGTLVLASLVALNLGGLMLTLTRFYG